MTQHSNIIELLQLISVTTPVPKPSDKKLKLKAVEIGTRYHEQLVKQLIT